MIFLSYFIVNPILDKMFRKFKKFKNIKKVNRKFFLFKVVLNQFYIPYLGWMNLMNPDDKAQKDEHWGLKVTISYYISRNMLLN